MSSRLRSSNSYSGGTTISGGAINLQQANGLGSGSAYVATGAELELAGGFTTAATPLSLIGTGTNGTGALRNLAGNNTYAGPITLAGPTRINSDAGILTLSGGVSAGANVLTLGGSGTNTIVTTTVTAGGIVKDGSGQVNWNINGSIPAGSNVTISNGVFYVSSGGWYVNPFGNYNTITVQSGATLQTAGAHSLGTDQNAVTVNGGALVLGREQYITALTMTGGTITTLNGGELRNWGGTWTFNAAASPATINGPVAFVGNTVMNVLSGGTGTNLVVYGPIGNTASLTKTGDGTAVFNGTNTYSGPTTVAAGTLIIPTTQTGGGAFTNVDNTALGINITTGYIPLSYLVLGTNTGGIALTFYNFVGTTNAPIYATNLVTAGTTTITIANANARSFAVGQWPLIKYTGAIGGTGFGAFQLAPLPRGVVAVLVDNTANSSVDLNILANDQITWNGNLSGLWDTNTTANWLWNGAATTYQEPPVPGDGVLFDDTATGTTEVTLNQDITPLVVVFNNTNLNYSLGGTGTLNTNVIKNGTGTLTNNLGSFAKTISLNAGTVEMQSGGDVGYTVAPGATLRHGYNNPGGYNKSLMLNGSGAGDTHGLYIELGTTFSRNAMTIQTAPTTIRTYGTGGNATISGFDVNGDQMTIQTAASGSSVDPAISFTTGSYGYALNVAPGANTATGDLIINGPFVGTGSAQVRGENQAAGLHKFGTGSLLLTAPSTFTSGTAINDGSVIVSGGDDRLPVTTSVALGNGSASGKLILGGVNQTLSGLIVNGTGTANAVVGAAASVSTLTLTNASPDTFAGALGGTNVNENNLALTKTGAGVFALSASNTYVGDTIVANGTLQLIGDGSIASSAGLVVSNGATLDASTRTDTTLALASGQTLSGNGLVKGIVVIPAGAAVAPGGVAIGTLTLNNDLTLAGTATFRLDRTGTQNADRIAGIGAVTFGGTLTVVNTGNPLQAGDTFTLFNAASYNASTFAVTNLPGPGGRVWFGTPPSSLWTARSRWTGYRSPAPTLPALPRTSPSSSPMPSCSRSAAIRMATRSPLSQPDRPAPTGAPSPSPARPSPTPP